MTAPTGTTRNRAVLEGLARAEAEGRLHHAYILSGPEQAAKVDAVERFAARLFAQGRSEEEVLERVRRCSHPDLLRLEPVDGVLSVDEVRELPRALAYPPLEACRRLVLVADASALNAQAANAILKILEEPPGHTMFFLLARDPSELLQTIVSRCQVLRFAPLADGELLSALGEAAFSEKETLLGWSEGSVERARFLLAQEGALELRKEACERLLALWEASPRIPSASAQWIEGVDGEETCRIVVESWELLLRDLLFTAAGSGPEGLRFREYHGRLAALAGKGAEALLRSASGKSQAINRFRVYRELNGNLRLDLAALLAELQVFW